MESSFMWDTPAHGRIFSDTGSHLVNAGKSYLFSVATRIPARVMLLSPVETTVLG